MTITDSTEVVEARLSDWFASRMDSAPLPRLTPLSGGYSNPTYLVEFDGRPDRFVLRWDPIVGPQAPYDMVRQFETFRALSQTCIPVPQPYWLETDLSVLGRVFWVCEYVEGESTARLLPYDDPLAPARTDAFIDMIARIHATPWQDGPLADVIDRVSPTDVAGLIDAEQRLMADILPQDRVLFDTARAWLHRHRPVAFRMALNHGDCNLSNFLFRGSDILAVIDWELSSITDPMADVGFYCALLPRYRHGADPARVQAERADFLARYASATDADFSTLPFWEAFNNYRYALSWTQKGVDHPNSGYAAYRDQMARLIA